MYFPGLAGPIALIAFTAFMFLLVPWERIQRLLPVASFFGLISGLATYYILQNVIGAWRFQNADLLAPAGVPLFMTLAWIPYSIIFFHLIAQYRSFAHVVLLILIAGGVPTFFHFLLEINGMVVFQNWSWSGNFLYATSAYTAAALIYYRYRLGKLQRINE
jgi:hypothetical protein